MMNTVRAETIRERARSRHRSFRFRRPSGRRLIGAAVKQHSAVKRQGILERLFTHWFNGLVYNQIWEDPHVDTKALEMDSSSRVLTIASGGCNVLNYLIKEPKQIFAVDLNPSHMYLTRLKLAALKHLPSFEDFFRFFGAGKGIENIQSYHEYISRHLDHHTRLFWEGRGWRRLFGRERIKYFKRDFYRYSRSASFMRVMGKLSRLLSCDVHRVFEARSIDEQIEAFERHVAPGFDHWLVRKLASMPWVVFSLGIPPQQYKCMRESDGEALVRLYKERVRRLICGFPLESNYFAWQALRQRYNLSSSTGVPDYLMRENYLKIRKAADRVTTRICSLTDFLKTREDRSLDCFVFLDSQDWMNEETLNEMWREISRVASDGARIIFRTAAAESPLESKLSGDLLRMFRYEKERSAELYQQDRSAVYGGFHLYRKVA